LTRSRSSSTPSSVPESTEPFVHRIRVRYAEIDGQGVVFNAHWLTYFDDACTRFMESLGFGSDFWIKEFDVMLVKAVVEWSGSARFDNWIDVEVIPTRIGTKSFDLHYRASIADTQVCAATITYVAIEVGSNISVEIPPRVRSALELHAVTN
jgi:acyl-CoA thioester hydrolase